MSFYLISFYLEYTTIFCDSKSNAIDPHPINVICKFLWLMFCGFYRFYFEHFIYIFELTLKLLNCLIFALCMKIIYKFQIFLFIYFLHLRKFILNKRSLLNYQFYQFFSFRKDVLSCILSLVNLNFTQNLNQSIYVIHLSIVILLLISFSVFY